MEHILHLNPLKIYALDLWSILSMLLLMHLERIENHRLLHIWLENWPMNSANLLNGKWDGHWTSERLDLFQLNWHMLRCDRVIYVCGIGIWISTVCTNLHKCIIKSQSEMKNGKLIIKTHSDTRHTNKIYYARSFSTWLHVIIGHKQQSHTMTENNKKLHLCNL